jgi:hypothetical protein
MGTRWSGHGLGHNSSCMFTLNDDLWLSLLFWTHFFTCHFMASKLMVFLFLHTKKKPLNGTMDKPLKIGQSRK